MVQVLIRCVTTPALPPLFLDVNVSESVAQLKLCIALKVGIPSHRCLLIFAGKRLDDSLTLSEYNVQKESTIFAKDVGDVGDGGGVHQGVPAPPSPLYVHMSPAL